MRKHARSWIIKIALGVIILAFVFLYGGSTPQDPGANMVADVNGTVITVNYFRTMYDAQREALRQRYKGKLPNELLEKLNLKKELVNKMIHQILLLQEAQRLGFFVTEDDLINDIRSDPRFQRAGVFDQRIYNAYLRSANLSASAYEKSRRQELLQEQVVHLLTDSVKFDPGEIKEFWRYQNDKLILSMLLIEPAPPEEIEIEDPKALEAFYNKNQDDYRIPRQFKIEYVTFSGKDLEDGIEISNDQARQYYEANPEEFTTPEKVRAKHILLKVPEEGAETKPEEVKERIEKIRERIVSGEDFSQVAKEVSEDEASKEKGGALGLFSRGVLSEPLDEVAFELEEGQISAPVKTSLGYHLIKVEEKIPENRLSFDEAKEKIVSKLKAEEARRKVNTIADEFYEKVYRSENLQQATQEFGFELKEAENVTLNSGIPGLSAAAEVSEELASLSENEISKLFRVGDSFAVMKITEIIEPRIPELEEVKDEVRRDFLKVRGVSAAREKAENIIEKIKAEPDDIDKIAQSHGLTWQTLEPVARTVGLVPKLGTAPEIQEVLSTVSKAAPLYPEPVPVSEGIALIRLKKLKRADEADFEKEKASFERWITQVRANEYLNSWIKLLRDRSEIEINEKNL
jgi:peptidyl-prolyl cis-trans isomerase D